MDGLSPEKIARKKSYCLKRLQKRFQKKNNAAGKKNFCLKGIVSIIDTSPELSRIATGYFRGIGQIGAAAGHFRAWIRMPSLTVSS